MIRNIIHVIFGFALGAAAISGYYAPEIVERWVTIEKRECGRKAICDRIGEK